jgi:hypothetical protein
VPVNAYVRRMNFEQANLAAAIILLSVAAYPLRLAWLRSRLYATDVALLVSPTIIFVATILVRARGSGEQVAWALVLFPLFVLAMSVAGVYISIFIGLRLGLQPRAMSAIILASACLLALFGGLRVSA